MELNELKEQKELEISLIENEGLKFKPINFYKLRVSFLTPLKES